MHAEDVSPQGGPVPGATPGHEHDRVGLRGVIFFAIALFVTVIVVESVLGLAMKGLAALEKPVAGDAPARKVIEVDQFPSPRLQPNPMAELVEMKDEERKHVDSYGWVDRKAGIARIPSIGRWRSWRRTACPGSPPRRPRRARPRIHRSRPRASETRRDPRRNRAVSHENVSTYYSVGGPDRGGRFRPGPGAAAGAIAVGQRRDACGLRPEAGRPAAAGPPLPRRLGPRPGRSASCSAAGR